MSTARTTPLPERNNGTAHHGRANSDGGYGINTPAAGASGIARANTLASACLVYDSRGSALDTAARAVLTGPLSPNSECHLGPHQMLATIKQGSNITPDDLIANHDPLIAVAFVLRLVWFVRVVVAGTVSWVPLFSPSAVELYFSMVVAAGVSRGRCVGRVALFCVVRAASRSRSTLEVRIKFIPDIS